MSKTSTRRAVNAALTGLGMASARAQAKPLKLALIAPLSGPWARQGQLMRMGAEMALEEINGQGGIKALGGAKLELVVADGRPPGGRDNTDSAPAGGKRHGQAPEDDRHTPG